MIASIRKSETTIADNDKKIADARARIAELEGEIGGLRDQADTIRRRCQDLEIQVERLRTDITVAESKDGRIDDQIRDLTIRINAERDKIDIDVLNNLNNMIDSLKNLIPGIEK